MVVRVRGVRLYLLFDRLSLNLRTVVYLTGSTCRKQYILDGAEYTTSKLVAERYKPSARFPTCHLLLRYTISHVVFFLSTSYLIHATSDDANSFLTGVCDRMLIDEGVRTTIVV